MITIKARIQLLKSADGGRQSRAASGYRPSLRFAQLYTDMAITFQDPHGVSPPNWCLPPGTVARVARTWTVVGEDPITALPIIK